MKMKFKRTDYLRYEGPKGRTLGECLYAEILAIRMIDGVLVSTLYINNKPERLPRECALLYYTNKLRKQWNKIN